MPRWITKLLKSKKKFLVVPALVLATGGTALAVVTADSGTTQLQMLNRADNDPLTDELDHVHRRPRGNRRGERPVAAPRS